MEFSLVNAGLAAGAALAALPVILHLFMRQKPRRVVFPALQLIRERQKRAKKKLRVRNWLLLLARMAVLALMALALSRPRLHSQSSVGDWDVPSSTALVFDTSLSMAYEEQGKTRLAEAKEKALQILQRKPNTSLVYVIDGSNPVEPKGVSPATARKQVETLEISSVSRPLNRAVGLAYAALAGSDRPRNEVFVFTDLARSAWDPDRPVEGLDKIKQVKNGVRTIVIRFTPTDLTDVAVADAHPSADVATEGEPVEIQTLIRSKGPATTRVAELWMDGIEFPRDKKPVEIPANGEAPITFTLPKVDASVPVHQGVVRLTGGKDPLAFDDERYFTFSVKPAINVLVVSDRAIDAKFLLDAVDPDPATLAPGSPRPFRAERIAPAKFAENATDLGKKYRCIFLNNVERLSESDWAKIGAFVQDGGGLVVGLGPLSQPDAYAGDASGPILPATLEKVVSLKESTTFGQVADFTHPLFSKYPKELDAVLSQVPIQKYWQVKPKEGTRILLSFADKSPALIERVFKGTRTGRVLLWTTPLSREPDATGTQSWNEFPLPLVGWSYWYLMNQSVAYLAGTSEEGRNFEAGKNVMLPIDPTRRSRNYLVQPPGKKGAESVSPPADSPMIVVESPQQIGNWMVRSADSERRDDMTGFSLNAPAGETDFPPLAETDLNRLFGGKEKQAYDLVSDPTKIEQQVSTIYVGRELFPWIMVAIMVVVTLESVLANRFYRESSPQGGLVGAA